VVDAARAGIADVYSQLKTLTPDIKEFASAVGPDLLAMAKDTWGEFKTSLPTSST
jgi:hypothetical protein